MKLFKRMVLFVAAVGMLSFCLTERTPHGTDCQKSASPDELYIAERCLLKWIPGGNSEYVGRVFTKNGKLLAQRTFSTPVADFIWSDGVCASDGPELPEECTGPGVLFSRGDPSQGDSSISLPPSWWDRFLAARPRL
ncbi:hypothetical protein GIY62_20890 [Burkholderia plantarii]|uniref:hypothetical protein n=1 Tax=Burkholderia plantarii TaxID=41899 RepID=UPI0018DD3805|nr:hypothetical protein [Burkholderia plantarii]MBI0329513.1 hypothetical protein [Burkholderia plantarii]WLE62836.1 hypothetical protein GIY62_20890 [Burkholderia plantarii]